MVLGIFPQHRPVSRELQRYLCIGPSLHLEDFPLLAHALPAFVGLVSQRIGGVEGFEIKILLVDPEYGEAPSDALVVPYRDSGQAGLAGADHIPTRRNEVHDVAQRGSRDGTMRVIGQQRTSAFGKGAGNNPVI